MEFTFNMKYLVSSAMDCTLRVWELATGQCQRIVRNNSYFNTFYVNLNGDFIVAGADNGQLCFIDITKPFNQIFFKLQTGNEPGKAHNRIRSISASPDEKYFAVLKKNSISICPFEEVYKYGDEFKDLEKKQDPSLIKEYWHRENKSLYTNSYLHEKLDLISGQYCFHNRIIAFCRNKSS